MRRPTPEEWWLALGYTVWFCLIWSLWQIITRVLPGR
jgi:hypothetical protein